MVDTTGATGRDAFQSPAGRGSTADLQNAADHGQLSGLHMSAGQRAIAQARALPDDLLVGYTAAMPTSHSCTHHDLTR